MRKTAPRSLKNRILPTVHNGVSLKNFPYHPKKADYFMTLARFNPDKGQSIAVQACVELGYKLKMIGIVNDITSPRKLLLELGNPLSRYRSSIDFRYFSDHIFPYLDDQIVHLGDVSRNRKVRLLARAKALLFPIQWEEPFGMAPIEALACGTPVIAMARGALPEIIEHGVNGFLAKTESQFKKYMNRINDIDPAACRASVEAKFSAPLMAQRYLERYQQAISLSKK